MTDVLQEPEGIDVTLIAVSPPFPSVLTIQQPWAGAIFHLEKDVENRTWRTGYRGLLLVHTSKRGDPAGLACIRQILDREIDFGSGAAWTTGAIIGAVDLVGCARNHPSIWTAEDQYQLVLANPREVVPPVPCRGNLGLWEPSEEIACAVANRLAATGHLDPDAWRVTT